MFNGIIKNKGNINKISKKDNNCILVLKSKIKFSKSEIGSSISCSGACLTLEKYTKNLSTFYISKETLNRTIFKYSKVGDEINLEKSLKYGQRLSGHFIMGHIDTTAKVNNIVFLGKSWVINFKISGKYRKYLMHKGSIAINGVSLTIANVIKNGFQIAIIPKTLKLTNLISLKKKDTVNVELDILGKYVKRFFRKK